MRLLREVASAFRVNDWTLNRADPGGLRYVATVSVWGRWFINLVCIVLLTYRPLNEYSSYIVYLPLLVLSMASNGYVHYRLVSKKTMTWHWILALSALDIALITGAAVAYKVFDHYLLYLFYYPALAIFALTFSSFRLNILWVSVVAAIYAYVSVTVGDGIDLEERDDKVLFTRIAVMYVLVAAVNLVSRFERVRWRAAVERARELQQERVAFSQSIHDTMAQSAYMINLGLDTAKEYADATNNELIAQLDAISSLSQSTMWDLRHPIDVGRVFEGRELGRALRSHADAFTTITSVPAEVVQHGTEPPILMQAKGALFAIVHNALTNIYRHAMASRVVVKLEFGEDSLRLSVADDGVGLPDDYAARGHGFANMRAGAKRLGGYLLVESNDESDGTIVTCTVPYECIRGGEQDAYGW